ncbi:sugar ABC transporter ATP-binding protein [Tropicimonas sp. IMCC34043]|uniref:sugar ABC transporter ATP-binding protein n=1 Tax=Tropicimonas sp. IMCC34043 TaxID=2248760 RepID=UPI001E547CC9|nr:sugar ABC transporter ATP-binding protein [Tropicimonas sp. IMCC34043]
MPIDAGGAHELRLEGLGRQFGAVRALDSVDLVLRAGEVHALMGENGAGKSTLIRCLAGLERPDAGRILLDGLPLPSGHPAAVRAAGLRFIHQELHAVRGLSVAENMFLDHPYPRRAGLVNWRAVNRAAQAALSRLGVDDLDPRQPMTGLGPGDQMIARIAGTLIDEGGAPPWLYVMDEPTAALTGAESERLFAVIGEMIAAGAGVLYVSHRMPEVLRLSDRVTVLRDGRHISTRPLGETGQERIIHEMTGRDLSALFPPRDALQHGDTVLGVRGLAAPGIRDVSFDLRAGEILGVVGLAGAGQGALLRALIGAAPRRGMVTLDGQPLSATPAGAWAQGLAYVPPERRSQGLMLGRSITENVALPHLERMARGRFFLNRRQQARRTGDLGAKVRLKAATLSQGCSQLSGGNQQKVLFARALAGAPRVLLLDEPTRGVDIGAKSDLYRLIRQLADDGVAVLLASSDLPEVLGLADRIAVMQEGRLTHLKENSGMTEASLLASFYDSGDAA